MSDSNRDDQTQPETKTTASSYTGSDIEILEGLEAVRTRPGMYIGDTGPSGYQHCAFEIIDNSIDEALAGYCTAISVVITKNGGMIVRDNGRGIPVDNHPGRGISAATVILTELHAGGKFKNGKQGSSYKVSGGLHGVGSSVVNALSEHLILVVYRDGNEYEQSFHRGTPDAPLKVVGKSSERGTSIYFKLDPEIFKPEDNGEPLAFSGDGIKKSLAIRSYLNPGLTITFTDMRTGEKAAWKTERFSQILDTLSPIKSEPILPLIEKTVEEETEHGDVMVMYAMRIQNERPTIIDTFANGIHTKGGGSHEAGLKAAILRAYNRYADVNKLVKAPLTSADVLEGLVASVAVRLSDPQFAGQTKDKLNNSYIRGIVESSVYQAVTTFFEENPKQAKAAIARAERAALARVASEKVRDNIERKSILNIGSLPGKLADCQDKNPENCEIFIVEGDSAGGSAKSGRNRFNQAILPLRGKIKNAISSATGALSSEEARNLIIALGCGSVSGKNFDITKLRYHKIILLTDADIDGEHIFTLAMSVLYKETPELIRAGHVYIGHPPLFRVKKGKEDFYIKNQKELENFFSTRDRKGWAISRFKGLGEMNDIQLGETTLDPAKRGLTQILFSDQVSDAHDVLHLKPPVDENGNPTPAEDVATMDDETFDILLGKGADNRKTFIASNTTFTISI